MFFRVYASLSLLFAAPGWASNTQGEAMLSSAPGPSPSSALLSTPNTCVALRQGRTCYSDITLSWQVANEERYCIRQSQATQVLHCWQQQQQGELVLEFASATAQGFELVHVTTGKVLASTEVRVQWVYTSGQKKRRWRLF
ncbi:MULTISPECIES: DUF3019 domain-containing protein [unclassified Pseudoalteromonas]|uniref:DUF3019 domain-containing protein n=1 Tax=unclassified Pseudoalteromonas TaxID=194690 RepID=UPI000CF74F70|nr:MULTISPECIES: DUF3019 domain-containing protein [unclassified Pseudoalteromonas]MBS3796309.1 DUF3019 domain-containing protein [Pseudoalteromonas sp. BDTF-M6]